MKNLKHLTSFGMLDLNLESNKNNINTIFCIISISTHSGYVTFVRDEDKVLHCRHDSNCLHLMCCTVILPTEFLNMFRMCLNAKFLISISSG